MPALAMPGLPRSHSHADSPSTTNVPAPFSTQTPPKRAAISCAAARRSACTSPAVELSKRAASPECGVSVQSARFCGWRASQLSASASTTRRASPPMNFLNTRSPHSSMPRPGPSTTMSAGVFAASASALINSGRRNAARSRFAASEASVTSPAPQRNAASADSSAAPNMPRAPPATSTRPASPLCMPRLRRGNSGGEMMRATGRTARRAAPGTRKSSNNTSPAWSRPSPVNRPIFRPIKVKVACARTHGENARPPSPRPDGMSSANTAARPEAEAALMRAIKSAATPCGARPRPVPNSASAMTSASPGNSAPDSASRASPPLSRYSRAAAAASSLAGAPAASTLTRMPTSRARAAST